jgi:hypothetical protein
MFDKHAMLNNLNKEKEEKIIIISRNVFNLII